MVGAARLRRGRDGRRRHRRARRALFARLSRPAAALLLPYWAWVTFAAALNFSIWQLN